MQITIWASTGINAEKAKEIYKEGLITREVVYSNNTENKQKK